MIRLCMVHGAIPVPTGIKRMTPVQGAIHYSQRRVPLFLHPDRTWKARAMAHQAHEALHDQLLTAGCTTKAQRLWRWHSGAQRNLSPPMIRQSGGFGLVCLGFMASGLGL